MDLTRDLGPIMTTSDLSQLILRKLVLSQDFVSVMQQMKVE